MQNPFRPGAGHMPPYLAGRTEETREFERLLKQDVILQNLILTGLRGVGKTVLLETFRPKAVGQGWHWAASDLSESSSVTEERMATRIMADLATATSGLVVAHTSKVGFLSQGGELTLNYEALRACFTSTPGLVSDKLKAVLEVAWEGLRMHGRRGIVFAYDEAQNLGDREDDHEFALSLLLDVFQSIQRKQIPFMLVLTGLPTLFPKLVESRTYSERMFRVLFLDRLSEADSRDAILKPIMDSESKTGFAEESVNTIVKLSGGYPYFIQFICREVFDLFLQGRKSVPSQDILRKLDVDFFAGRWARATERQRQLLGVIAKSKNADAEFTVQEIAELSKQLTRPFSPSLITQMLAALGNAGLIYKNRHGRYSFAVPLMSQFIRRQTQP